jgi:hypothetical protein
MQWAGASLRFREYCQQSVVTGSDYLHYIISMPVTTETTRFIAFATCIAGMVPTCLEPTAHEPPPPQARAAVRAKARQAEHCTTYDSQAAEHGLATRAAFFLDFSLRSLT